MSRLDARTGAANLHQLTSSPSHALLSQEFTTDCSWQNLILFSLGSGGHWHRGSV
uniref:Uncharacterized protein n=1 Tax=Arundo donax TaxID=35708 RepID=A0A0A9EDV5_ARUDO